MRILIVVGARPNFMKAAPLVPALEKLGADVALVHTGQHFDAEMSSSFFDLLRLPEPQAFLGVGGGAREQQFASVVAGVGRFVREWLPDRVLTVGDVTSTAAAAVAADACEVPVDHVEAGLRSFDLTMPEERNRRVADVLADMLFVSEPSGVDNLLREGKPDQSIHLVGNVMIDTLDRHLDRALNLEPWRQFNLIAGEYAVVTAHRPSNVDSSGALEGLCRVLSVIRESGLKAVFPVHPRTSLALRQRNASFGDSTWLELTKPLDYLSFIGLVAKSKMVLTDSGGLQEETTVLNVPCLTLRGNTERPITLVENGGTSVLTGMGEDRVRKVLSSVVAGTFPPGRRPDLWDGCAAERIAAILGRWGTMQTSSQAGKH